jgi:hypothetical protein
MCVSFIRLLFYDWFELGNIQWIWLAGRLQVSQSGHWEHNLIWEYEIVQSMRISLNNVREYFDIPGALRQVFLEWVLGWLNETENIVWSENMKYYKMSESLQYSGWGYFDIPGAFRHVFLDWVYQFSVIHDNHIFLFFFLISCRTLCGTRRAIAWFWGGWRLWWAYSLMSRKLVWKFGLEWVLGDRQEFCDNGHIRVSFFCLVHFSSCCDHLLPLEGGWGLNRHQKVALLCERPSRWLLCPNSNRPARGDLKYGLSTGWTGGGSGHNALVALRVVI